MSDTLVLVNPRAGGGRAGGRWNALQPAARSLASFHSALPPSPERARELVTEAVATGCRRVVVVGGDGSVHLVVNALMELGAAGDVTVGLVPAGTGSDLARVLRVPRDPPEAMRRALLAPGRPVDAGRCAVAGGPSFAFVNIASAGISGLVDETVNSLARRGRTAFLRATLSALRRYRCVPLELEVDGTVLHRGPALLAAVANGSTFGKGMRIAPGADPGDGLFDVVAVGEVAGLELLRRLPQVYLGRHLGAKPVRHARGRSVRLTPLAPLPVLDVDGETYPSGPAVFEMAAGAWLFAGGAGERP